MGLKLSRYLVVTDTIHDPLDGREKRILFGTRTGSMRVVDSGWWERLSAGDFASVPPRLINELKESNIVVDSQEDELARVLTENRTAIANTGRFFLAILPTAECQLSCYYCGQFHREQTLSQGNQDRLVQRVRDKLEVGQYRNFKVTWYGGEPLLAMDIIRSLSQRFKAVSNEFGCTYHADLVTNGILLTSEIGAELSREHCVRHVDVTLDGTDRYHDQRRYGKNGTPSFWIIFNNIVALARRDDLDPGLRIRCNVDHRNRDGVLPLLQLLVDYGLHERLEKVYIMPVHAWVKESQELSVNPREFATWEIEWLAQMNRLGFRNIDLIQPRNKIVCFAVEPDGEEVDAFGNLFNCSEISYVRAYERTTPLKEPSETWSNMYSIGSLESGEEPGKRELLAKFNDRIERGEIPCNTCAILPVCGGSCPKYWHIGLVPCPPVKFNIIQRLILQYHLVTSGINRSREANKVSLIESALNLNFQNCLRTVI